MNKKEKLLIAEIVIGFAAGLFLRKKMADTGMIKSFWKPGMIRKPGTYMKCKVCNSYIEPVRYEDEFGAKPTKDSEVCTWGCLHALADKK